MEKTVLKANLRKTGTKSELNQLRTAGRVPGVFYSKVSETLSIDVSEKEINPIVFTAETHLISLQVNGHEEYECVIKDIQFDPVNDKVVHFDLIGLIKDETFQLEVPVQLVGSPIGVKEGGLIQHIMHKLEIECLPKDIPQHLEVNIAQLKIGDSVHVADLNFENIKILNPKDSVVVAITHPKQVKEVIVEEGVKAEPAEPEVIGKGKASEDEEN
jgi:large subunit ribosomal protein L25